MPGSNKFPHFNKENLEKSLKKMNIKYIHLSCLGGRKKKELKNVNTYWKNKSFSNYADYAFFSKDFKEGIKKLINLSSNNKLAIMCAEVLWWRCHRRIITDYLIKEGIEVFHIFNINKKEKAVLNGNAFFENDNIIYK